MSLWDLKLHEIAYFKQLSKIWTLSLWDLKQLIMVFNKQVKAIWTLSLWDLKPLSIIPFPKINKFELCPYGIWNIFLSKMNLGTLYLNFVPMGFETLFVKVNNISFYIWTLSLWDLKPDGAVNKWKNGTIWTLSLWDLKHGCRSWSTSPNQHLNFVPMGFETLHFQTLF